jgi:hypothetical protein
MTLADFAVEHRLSVRRDVDGTLIAPGRMGHLYEDTEERLGLLFVPDPNSKHPARSRCWRSVQTRCLAAGMVILQEADDEGTLGFDPDDPKQASLAIRTVGVRRKRKLSPEHKARLVGGGQSSRYDRDTTGLNMGFPA